MYNILLFILNNRIVYFVGLVMAIAITSLIKAIMKAVYNRKLAKYEVKRLADSTLPEMPKFNADKFKWLYIIIAFVIEAIIIALIEILYFKTASALYISLGSLIGGLSTVGSFNFTHGGYKITKAGVIKIACSVVTVFKFLAKQANAYKAKKLTAKSVIADTGILVSDIEKVKAMSNEELAKYLVDKSGKTLPIETVKTLFHLN